MIYGTGSKKGGGGKLLIWHWSFRTWPSLEIQNTIYDTIVKNAIEINSACWYSFVSTALLGEVI